MLLRLLKRKFFVTKKKHVPVADTFVEATGGGWFDVPDVVAADGGSQADYVGELLRQAKHQACDESVPVGGEFTFTVTNIPEGISSPHEIMFGLMMRAGECGLMCTSMIDEKAFFIRVAE